MIRTLQLVTTRRPFFEQQVDVLEDEGVVCDVVTVPRPPEGTRSLRQYASFYRDTLREAWNGDYDVVHANYGLTAPAALAQPTRPVVLSLWGSDVMGQYGALSEWCAQLADAVIVMSEEMREELGVECTVVPHGIDMDLFSPAPKGPAREEVGWTRDENHVLFPYDTARDAKDYPRAKRVVERAERRLGEDIELQTISGVPHERMPTYVNAADALLLTSKWEGSPNSVREALACNRPVVTTDVGDIAEYAADIPGAVVSDDDEELARGVADAVTDGDAFDGREHVREYSLERMGENIIAVYESVLGAPRTEVGA
ncbi:glycosyltransferase family 4 protein [Halopelagius longus]|uniref:Glycosyltransferase n=1 Tax=Halopelagius longus TaxID=1236180 RepID=A0A1H1GIG8_9EURY|nr:glycosyltransferase family 4 protein [Halopelagius longus]RDI69720.1 glycosyltransferase [Halopelagius longus]SDR13024.1 Glycosyltransferase Family 4 [Halopelagius longus]